METIEKLIEEIGEVTCCGCCHDSHDISEQLKRAYELGKSDSI